MQRNTILTSQKIEMFKAINEVGLNPVDFDWVEQESDYNRATIVSKLVHRSSDYFYTFDLKGDRFAAQYSPASSKAVDYDFFDDWEEQFDNAYNWLTYVKREIEAFDPWAIITQESAVINATNSNDLNTPFSADEKKYVISGINEIKQYLLTAHKLDPELVESRLSYLVEASDRVGRKDWINLLLSVMIGIVVAAALPPETTREIFRFVGSVLSQILHQPLLLT